MNVSKFTSKENLLNYIEENLHLQNVKVSKLYEGDKVEIETSVLFQIRTSSRITLKDLSIVGLLHKDIGITFNEDNLLITWFED